VGCVEVCCVCVDRMLKGRRWKEKKKKKRGKRERDSEAE
jgi:hypothetical protein